MVRALGLMSGGLDSTLAAMTLMRQGIEVIGISFVTPFFGAAKARKAAEAIGFKLIVQEISDIHLDMVKDPQYGYGRNMNPCVDCHAMMFRLAGERAEQEGADFLFSGEVLGQRPMSQNRNALQAVAKLCGFPEKVLRPLSARLLPTTPMEEQGLVDRDQLLDIQGRSRKRQQALARAWGYPDFPESGGGCLLTEEGFSNQLRDLLTHDSQATVNDVNLLKVGRQFRLSPEVKLIVGRNQEDNQALETLAQDHHVQLRCVNLNGPLGLLSGPADAQLLSRAAAIVASYSKGRDLPQVTVACLTPEGRTTLGIAPMARRDVTTWQLI